MNFLGHQNTIFLEFVELINIAPLKNVLMHPDVINFRSPRGTVKNWSHQVQNCCVLLNFRCLIA